jgi:plasmid maintenance system antidote protein VapI
MVTQINIAQLLKIDQPRVSKLINGREKVSWPIAERLADIFPGKSIAQWKRATPQELKLAFSQLEGTPSEIKQALSKNQEAA